MGALVGLSACVVSCSAPGGGSDSGDSGNGDGGNGADSDGGPGGLDSSGGIDGPGTGGPGSGKYCQEADIEFVPKTPTVYVLVDRSSSMREYNFWTPLRTGVLSVIEQLQADVRFGFGSYTGQGGACTGIDDLGVIAENNYAAIAAKYNSIEPPDKGETPTITAVQQAREILAADPSPGDRFILLVSDGNPDFCDDGGASCGADALIAELQVTASLGIRTLIFGIQNSFVSNDYFHYFAQAGWGESPNWADGLDVGEYNGKISSECQGRGGWVSQRQELGRTGFAPNGLYSTEGGTKQAFLDSEVSALVEQVRSTVEGLKSCTFDLGTNGVEVKEGAEGDIFVNDEIIPNDQWRMNSPTVLELLGDACATWQLPEVTGFFAGFACDQLIVR